jgi:ribose transport system substrate-binding protein
LQKTTKFNLTTVFFMLDWSNHIFMCRRKFGMKKIMVWIAIGFMAISFTGCGRGTTAAESTTGKKDLTFVIVTKVVHEWFDVVNIGAQAQAEKMTKELGVKVTVDFRSPSAPEITQQNTILEQAAAMNPDGIAIDPLDYEGSKQIIEEIRSRGIPIILFDATVPGSGLTSTGNNFTEQANLEAEKLVELLNGRGKVAVMHGVPTAPNHDERYVAMRAVLSKYPGITIVDGGASQDQVEVSQQQAAAVIAANPDLAGFLCVDGAAPIGIAAAIEEAGKAKQITFVGAENLIRILHYIKSGTIICSYSTKPQMQGAMSVLLLWQAHMGMDLPQFVDTGILYIDQNNVDEWIRIIESGGSGEGQ